MIILLPFIIVFFQVLLYKPEIIEKSKQGFKT